MERAVRANRTASHPSWVRGLKQELGRLTKDDFTSHPSWVRGLKLYHFQIDLQTLQSHPSWVRGLKQEIIHQRTEAEQVAPFVGAWIETVERQSSYKWD